MNPETFSGRVNHRLSEKQHILEVAMGRGEADLVLKNATYVNVFLNELSHGDIAVVNGVIAGIGEDYHSRTEVDATGMVVLPGFIDGHIHLESSLVTPVEFAKAVLPHGTTTVITDPHEIANVMGTDGIEYILQATEGLPVDVGVMLPSCVPATPLDESGAMLDYRAIDMFYGHSRVLGLAEMMSFPDVINANPRTLEKIIAAQEHRRLIDGHAPGLSGHPLNAYIAAGVYSDHECSTLEEAMDKMAKGQHIMIREGTAAHNLDALLPLLKPKYAENCFFCTDDIHPSDLLNQGDIDHIIRRAIQAGVDPIIAVKCATLNPARYFGLNDRGAIAPGYLADFVLIDDFENFDIVGVCKKGELLYHNGRLYDIPEPQIDFDLVQRARDTFHIDRLEEDALFEDRSRAVLGIVPGQLYTTDAGYANKVDVDNDILKIIVAERHSYTSHIGLGYIKGYGLKRGAVATSISHDSHNIIAVGASEADIAAAVNRVIELNGGIVVWSDGFVMGEVPLQIGGIMSQDPIEMVNDNLEAAKAAAFELGVNRDVDPFMTLSFMALPVIPTLRITTRGVFDVEKQRFA